MIAVGFEYVLHYLRRQFDVFFLFTTLSCVHYLGSKNRKFARYFWLLVWFCSITIYLIIVYSLYWRFKTEPTISTIDVNDPGQPIQFPAIFICPERVMNVSTKATPEWLNQCLWNYVHLSFQYNESVVDCTAILPSLNIHAYLHNMKESIDVDQMLKNCSFGSRQFSCHRYFDMQLTELGPCIVFNSFLMQRNSLNEKMRRNEMFFLEETSPNWHLSFDLVGNAKDARIYMKSTTNLLSLRDKSTFTPSTEYHTTINFKIFGILNTPAVRALRPWQRKCYYSNEMFNDMKPYIRSTFYDESLCLNFCHAMLFVEKCNCLPHVYNDFFKNINATWCNIRNLGCLISNRNSIRTSTCKSCPQSCENVFYYPTTIWKNNNGKESGIVGSRITIRLSSWPLFVVRRTVVFGPLELFLSYGGCIGLFTGISFITAVEFFYFLFVYFFGHYERNKIKLQREVCRARLRCPRIDMSLWPRPRAPLH